MTLLSSPCVEFLHPKSVPRPRHSLPLRPAGQVKQPAAIAAVVAQGNGGLAGGEQGFRFTAIARLAIADAEAGAHGGLSVQS